MAHTFDIQAPAVLRNISLETEEILAAKVELAACFRMAARCNLHEGIDNHFSAVVPGHPDLFLVNPYGWAFDEIRASQILVCDFEGNVLSGAGEVEATAFYIHARLHKKLPHAAAAFHTHMPYATALGMVEGPPLLWASQASLQFYGRTAVDNLYNGLALDTAEGDRIAAAMGDAEIIFMRNHGVMVLGRSIAEAFDSLYFLERAAEVQVKAMSTGLPLKLVDPEVAEATCKAFQEARASSARAHLDSVRRRLDKEEPDYAH